MFDPIKQLTLSSAIALGAVAIGTPTLAMSFSTTGPITVFTESGGITQEDPAYSGDLTDILDGSKNAATGNVELYDNTDTIALPNFLALTEKGTLTAKFDDGKSITFSSLTGADWFGAGLDISYGANNLANQWFTDALASNGGAIQTIVDTQFGGNEAAVFAQFLNTGGFQRLSDPNIAYVTKENDTVTFGLAGHNNAGNVFTDPVLKQLFDGLFASEVVKVAYNGEMSYQYSFAQPFDSGVVNEDGFSHNGTFEFQLKDPTNGKDVPEPTAILGLIAVGGGLLAASKGSSKKI